MEKIVVTLEDAWKDDVRGLVWYGNGNYNFIASVGKDRYVIVSFRGRLWNDNFMTKEEVHQWFEEQKVTPIGRMAKSFKAKEIIMTV